MRILGVRGYLGGWGVSVVRADGAVDGGHKHVDIKASRIGPTWGYKH